MNFQKNFTKLEASIVYMFGRKDENWGAHLKENKAFPDT